MEKRKVMAVICMMLGLVLYGGGCGKEPEPGPPPSGKTVGVEFQVNETKPLEEIKAEAEDLETYQLREAALKYKEEAEAKFAEFTDINEQIKGIAVTEVEKLTVLKGDLDQLSASINALKERYQIYFDKLKELGGDVSDLELKIKI